MQARHISERLTPRNMTMNISDAALDLVVQVQPPSSFAQCACYEVALTCMLCNTCRQADICSRMLYCR